MADSAATNNVFLDTEVFDCHQFDFGASTFRRLVRLAAYGPVRVLLTTVTASEIRSHIVEHAEKAFKQVETVRKLLPLTRRVVTPEIHEALSSTSAEEFRQELHKAFDSFLIDTKATVISVDGVSPEAIFKAYFEVKPPFGKGAKKNEFPDAFASAALRAWAESDDKGKIYVVSHDKDWRRVCQDESAFIHQGRLSELLEKYADSDLVSYIRQAINDRRAEVKALLDTEAGNLYYFSADGVEAEIEEPDEVDVTINDFHVIEAKDGQATINLASSLHYAVTITDDDPDSGYSDPDDGERRYIFSRSGTVEGDDEVEATLTLQYDQAHPDRVTFVAVVFAQQEVHVSFEDHDLSREDDNDYDDYDFPDDETPEEET